MPRGDGTGPAGMGPMTGRGAGYCAGYATPGYLNPGGRGMGMAWGRGGGAGLAMAWRRGRGRGRALGFSPTAPGVAYAPMPFAEPTREQELDALRRQSDWLREQLDAVNARVTELGSEK